MAFLAAVSACSGDDNDEDRLGGVAPTKQLGSLTSEEAFSFCEANADDLVLAQRGACLRAALLATGPDVSECERISALCLERAQLGVDCTDFNPARLSECTVTAEHYQSCIAMLADGSRSLACGSPAEPLPACLNTIPIECPLPKAGNSAIQD